jgi:hypothetical protein
LRRWFVFDFESAILSDLNGMLARRGAFSRTAAE